MPSGMSICMSASTSRRSRFTCNVRRSFDAPGTSICSVMPCCPRRCRWRDAARSRAGELRAGAARAGALRAAALRPGGLRVPGSQPWVSPSWVSIERDHSRLGRLFALHRDLQHAVAVARVDPVGISVLEQRDGSPELAGETLTPVIRGLVVYGHLPLSGNGEQIL